MVFSSTVTRFIFMQSDRAAEFNHNTAGTKQLCGHRLIVFNTVCFSKKNRAKKRKKTQWQSRRHGGILLLTHLHKITNQCKITQM